jgi:hypothetical protein
MAKGVRLSGPKPTPTDGIGPSFLGYGPSVILKTKLADNPALTAARCKTKIHTCYPLGGVYSFTVTKPRTRARERRSYSEVPPICYQATF